MTDPHDANLPPITSLSKKQRRVLGTLIEKALTVPDSYPLTLNSLLSGCNQKSNRAPLANYDDSDIEETVNQLRDLGLVAAVHTEGGRTERYRHYVRRRFTLSEPQIGILTELLLRGRQAMGELRTRASRMTPRGSLDSLEQLRTELQGLLDLKLIQADGPLERRGVEIDHNLYQPQENARVAWKEVADEPPAASAPAGSPLPSTPVAAPGGPSPGFATSRPAATGFSGSPVTGSPVTGSPIGSTGGPVRAAGGAGADDDPRLARLEASLTRALADLQSLRQSHEELRAAHERLESRLEQLRGDLGG
ncbi:MAG: DUF480 domain-containing protein [Planctomycetaceae bacterium]